MSKRILWDASKYLLAFGLLTYVVWSNWGYSTRVAGRVADPAAEAAASADPLAVSGTVVAYEPGKSLVIADGAGSRTEFAVVEGKTRFSNEARLEAGSAVVVSEHPGRGLGYVWRRHVVEGEPVHLHFFLLACLTFSLSLLLTFWRWYVLVRAQGFAFSFADALRLGCVGHFFNTFMPGSVGGDIIKAAFLAREQRDRRTVAVATVLMDRAIAVWGLIWFVVLTGGVFWTLGLLEGPGTERSLFIVQCSAAVVAGTLAVWVLLGFLPDWRAQRFAGRLGRLPRVGHAAAELWRAIWMYRCRQKSVAAVMLISWVGHIGFVLTFYFSVRTLWDPADTAQRIPSFFQHFLIVPIGLVIDAVPLFPGGAGIGELGFGALYQWLGASVASGVLGSLVQRVVKWLLGLCCYGVYLRLRSALRQEKHKPPVEAAVDTLLPAEIALTVDSTV